MTDGQKMIAKMGWTYSTADVVRSAAINLTMLPDPLPAGALPGQFKINSGTGVVYFSKGNLVYTGSNWVFHDHQYDHVFTSDGTATDYPMDLFTWGNIASPTVNGTAYLDGSSNLSGSTDWGYNAITNGGNTANSGWRTLQPHPQRWESAQHRRVCPPRPRRRVIYGNEKDHNISENVSHRYL